MGVCFCNNCVYVCDSFVMWCVMVRGLCSCVLSLCVRVLNTGVLFVFYCVVLCVVSCVFVVSVCVFQCVYVFVCGLLCDVVWLPLMLVVWCPCALNMCRLCV